MTAIAILFLLAWLASEIKAAGANAPPVPDPFALDRLRHGESQA